MEWARENFDRLAVFAGALFLAICAFFIWRSAAAFNESFASLHAAGPPKAAAPTANALEVEAAIKKLAEPPQWTFSGRSGLFVPEKHFVGPNGMPATLQNTEVHPPVPNEWLDQFGLPIADADVLEQDADGDGFNNLEEWQGHTNPTDKNSHPPFVAKLKLKSVTTEPFPLVFSSSSGDTFAVNFVNVRAPVGSDGRANIDRSQPSQFVRIGDTIRGTKLKVAGFEEKTAPDRFGTEVDVSELRLQNIDTGAETTLVKEKAATSPESVATFVYLWGERREIQVKKDQEFSLPPQTEISYKLLDVQPSKAVIINTQKPDERIEIGLLSP
ncbi:MAG TPA: Amuc_1099 family pilus-like system protein [Chthoniobacterales bacterium]